jgi:hypothetical protein
MIADIFAVFLAGFLTIIGCACLGMVVMVLVDTTLVTRRRGFSTAVGLAATAAACLTGAIFLVDRL